MEDTLEARISGVEDVTHTKEALRDDNKLEHELTVREVLTNHPTLVWWIFFWAMAGVGWYVVKNRIARHVVAPKTSNHTKRTSLIMLKQGV